ncbi:MAG TPA: sulfite exporter TauE/SafE family protein [Mycobacteriales bacterium]|nr:sulfite exporter TauE/SafE family protein [Mycobacteriales bacterium]
MTVLALAFGMAIGLSLGALGGGGSILTVPVLVYVLGQDPRAATTGSLIIVGIGALTGAVGHSRSGRVRWRAGAMFGLTGVVASFAGTWANRAIAPRLLLVSFAALMVLAALAMLRRSSQGTPEQVHSFRPDEAPPRGAQPAGPDGPTGAGPQTPRTAAAPVRAVPGTAQGASVASLLLPEPAPSPAPLLVPWPARSVSQARGTRRRAAQTVAKVLGTGLLVGFLTGFFGVGGGFVIVPGLVFALGYAMPEAIGTSLLVIAINSSAALLARGAHQHVSWSVVLPFTLAAVIGSFAGKRLADRATGIALTRGFVVLLLTVATYVAVRSLTAS